MSGVAPFWQAFGFTAFAYLVPIALGWWAFGSKVPGKVGPVDQPVVSRNLTLAILLGLSGLSMWIGAFWDTSKHVLTGQVPSGADFLWAPHQMIYGSFLIMFLVAAAAAFSLFRNGRRTGVVDARVLIRRNPFIGAVFLFSLYALMSVPGDAIWHQIYGFELTAWSPPHFALVTASCGVIVSAFGLLWQVRSSFKRPGLITLACAVFLTLAINVMMIIGTIEWETPVTVRNPLVDARPIWLYPAIFGCLAFFMLVLARRFIARGGATIVAVAIYAFRLALDGMMGATGQLMPYVPPLMVLGAVLLDVVPLERIDNRVLRYGAMSAVYTVGYLLLGLPAQAYLRPDLPRFSAGGVVALAVVSLLANWLLAPLATLVGDKFNAGSAAQAVAAR